VESVARQHDNTIAEINVELDRARSQCAGIQNLAEINFVAAGEVIKLNKEMRDITLSMNVVRRTAEALKTGLTESGNLGEGFSTPNSALDTPSRQSPGLDNPPRDTP
jgi:hypothetical protein